MTARCVPARELGGDFFDILELDQDRLLFAIGDVSGKGVSAAIVMANLQAGFRMAGRVGRSLTQICSQLNTHLFQITHSSLFVTFFLAEWQASNSRLRYVNAGHPSPVGTGSLKAQKLEKGGVPLGMFREAEFEAGEILMASCDLLVCYSDGITEAQAASGEEFGEERLRDVVETCREEPIESIRERVFEAVRGWSEGTPEDDMTLMVVRCSEAAS